MTAVHLQRNQSQIQVFVTQPIVRVVSDNNLITSQKLLQSLYKKYCTKNSQFEKKLKDFNEII